MRLADFIQTNMEAILTEWEAFAGTLLPAAGGMDTLALRDHAKQILAAVAADLRTPQTRTEQGAKSRGEAPRSEHSPETAAETHAVLRATSGFTMQQMVAEYRALRATVLRLWAESHQPGRDTLVDVGRFNEAIDQAVAESVDFFTRETQRWRNVFLGVLGHDLRGPLNAILLTSQVISKLGDGTPISEATARLMRGGERMRQLLDDLLDYSRTSLELGLPITPASVDLATVCQEEVELQRLAWPGHEIELATEGPTRGAWDASRLKQVLGNLIGNAAKYGDRGTPIDVVLAGAPDHVVLAVENTGPSIGEAGLDALFEPLRRGGHAATEGGGASLGLGLFIVRQIVRAHAGTVTVSSAAGKTAFKVTLPKQQAAQ
jgi:signal transduction histidine kinase